MSQESSNDRTSGLSKEAVERLGVVGHELKTPIAVLKTEIQLFRRRLGRGASPQEVDSVLDKAEKEIDRLANLTRDLMSFAKTGQFSPVLAPCNLNNLIAEAVCAQRVLTPEREIIFNNDSPPVQDLADADRIRQVIDNYITNAMKYSSEGPIRVVVYASIEHVRVSVGDSGIGLSDIDKERVWDLGYQTRPGQGIGVGLHVCKKIIEAHGGQVGVESKAGVGSIFWFTLPWEA